MGEVYRAEDTNLKREVAIKVLPEAFVQDPGRFARFEREAHQTSETLPSQGATYPFWSPDSEITVVLNWQAALKK